MFEKSIDKRTDVLYNPRYKQMFDMTRMHRRKRNGKDLERFIRKRAPEDIIRGGMIMTGRSRIYGRQDICGRSGSGYGYGKARRASRRRHSKNMFRLGTLLVMMLLSLGLALLPDREADAQAEDALVYYKYYTNVKIGVGDSLWGYAEQYRSPEGMSHEDYIQEVKSINHLADESLVAGRSIILPYYSTEYVCSQ